VHIYGANILREKLTYFFPISVEREREKEYGKFSVHLENISPSCHVGFDHQSQATLRPDITWMGDHQNDK
jgi:hypothetical protein